MRAKFKYTECACLCRLRHVDDLDVCEIFFPLVMYRGLPTCAPCMAAICVKRIYEEIGF